MEVILPCAGLSTRFPGLRPKYLLTDYSGKMMIESAVKNFIDKYNITIVILREHDEKYNVVEKLYERFANRVNVIILDTPTKGPADTVYQALKQMSIDDNSILIKDCDGFFDSYATPGNVIYVANLAEYPNIRTAAAKSYTVTNEQGIITTVIEKQIVSQNFCVGGYQFETAAKYIEAFEAISKSTSEIFVSHIIDYMINKGDLFLESGVKNFVDVGILEDWLEYNNKPTYFCDIDGTIVDSGYEDYGNEIPLIENINFLLTEYQRGCKMVFTTSRKEKYRDQTALMLANLGFEDFHLLMEMNHSKRILINDFAPSNPYPTAVAVNLRRNEDKLKDYL